MPFDHQEKRPGRLLRKIVCREQQGQARLILGKKESPGGRSDTIIWSQVFSSRSKSFSKEKGKRAQKDFLYRRRNVEVVTSRMIRKRFSSQLRIEIKI
jgi:hypothetical protein